MWDKDAMIDLLEKKRIEELIYSYCIVGDRSDVAGLRALYHPDARDDHGTAANGPAENFLSLIEEAAAQRRFGKISHNITNIVIRRDGNYAEAVSYVIAFHMLKDEAGAPFDYLFVGRYLDRVEKRDGEWKFLHRRVVSDMAYRTSPSMMHIDDPVNAGIDHGSDSAADPMYAFLRLFHRKSA